MRNIWLTGDTVSVCAVVLCAPLYAPGASDCDNKLTDATITAVTTPYANVAAV